MSGKYRTIVADPPWVYEGFATQPGLARKGAVRAIGKVPLPYASLSVEEIAELPVGHMAADDARLFLWTTMRYLPAAFGVMAAWGFVYKQTLVWHKTGNPSPFGGSIAPNHAEFLLVGAKGSPRVGARLSSSVIAAPAAAPGKRPGGARSHSAKPEIFLDLVEQASDGPYVELFARRSRLGWDAWGDQSASTAEMPDLAMASSGAQERETR